MVAAAVLARAIRMVDDFIVGIVVVCGGGTVVCGCVECTDCGGIFQGVASETNRVQLQSCERGQER